MNTKRVTKGLSSLLIAVATYAVFAAPNTYVATTGSDSAPCTLAAPCRTFFRALLVTDSGGRVTALDSGEFGGVVGMVIANSVEITTDNADIRARVTVPSSVSGAVISAPSTGYVIFRNIDFVSQAGADSNVGIHHVTGAFLYVDQCTFSNMDLQSVRAFGGPNSVLLITNSAFFSKAERPAIFLDGVSFPAAAPIAFVDKVHFYGNASAPVLLRNGATAYMTNIAVLPGI